MEQSVYVNLSVVDLKPTVLNFLSDLAEAAKESVFVTRIKDLAEKLGKDIRTVQRYLKELTTKEIIDMRGRKGRAGGTIIRFNADLIQFTTSDKALINSEEPVDIDELLQTKIPKKQQEPNPNKRPRRTKSQMLEAKLLQDEKQAEIDKLNGQLQILGGVPNWEWFQKTEDPVGNYRTYLLSRLYNRYAALYIDRYNTEALVMKTKEPVTPVTDSYDVLGLDKVLGTSRWAQFEKFRLFCTENKIDPAAYLTAQFNRSTLTPKGKDASKMLPFVNALTSDASYDVYLGYYDYQERKDSAATFYNYLPHEFASDFVVQAICDAYETADNATGMFEFRGAISGLLRGSHYQTDEQYNLASYYYHIVEDMKKNNVPKKSQSLIKKFYVLQSLIQTEGRGAIPKHAIIGSEIAQTVLASIEYGEPDKKKVRSEQELALGRLVLPCADVLTQQKEGQNLYYQLKTLTETRQVLKLIQDRKGLLLPLNEIRKALDDYDRAKVPADDFSMLKVDEIVAAVGNLPVEEELDLEAVTEKEKWVLQGSVGTSTEIDELIGGLQLD